MRFKVNFTDGISILYQLVDHEIVNNWITLISQRKVSECCEINHYSGCYAPALLSKRVARLHELIDTINLHVPNKITKIGFTKENFHNALNTMHVHFPELEHKPEYSHLQPFLSEYNDTIHWLEPMLIDYYSNITDNSKFSIKLDFNKLRLASELFPIPESAYELFNGYFTFGQLMLHYVHVGRHAWELFFANDLVCPKEQYLPQSLYNATVRMHFYNNTLDAPEHRMAFRRSWEKFYAARGGHDFFDCDIDDPKLRFGYCQIGSLSNVLINNQETMVPKTLADITIFRNKLVNTRVIDWEII